MAVFESRGRFYAKPSIGGGKRPSVLLPTVTTRLEAAERDTLMTELVSALRAVGQADFIDVTLQNVATFPPEKLPEVRAYVLERLCSGTYVKKAKAVPLTAGTTFGEFAKRWTSGQLAKDFPDYVRAKRSAGDDVYRLDAHVLPVIGDVPLRAMTLAHAKEVMRRLPEDLSGATRRHYAQLIRRVLTLATWPAEIIPANPIPKGFLPKLPAAKAGTFLRPKEEAKLLARVDVPLVRRLLYGFLSREGVRRGEAAGLLWSHVDLEEGTVTVDRNKEGKPKAWMLDTGVREALARWKKRKGKTKPGDYVFSDDGGAPLNVEHLADQLRADLTAAGVVENRPELVEQSASRRRIVAHSLRNTFVTLSFAAGKDATWISDRTGHDLGSGMLARYRRGARMAEEMNLGPLLPLYDAIPELASGPVCTLSARGSGGRGPSRPAGKKKRAATGRRGTTGFRFRRRKAYEFKSRLVHKKAVEVSPVREVPGRSADTPTPDLQTPRARLVSALGETIRSAGASGDWAAVRVASDALRALLGDEGGEQGDVVDLAAERARRGGS